MPGDHKSEDAVKDLEVRNFDQNVEEKSPLKLKTIPLKLLEDEHCGELLRNVEDKRKTLGHREALAEKERRTKIIPVRHVEEDNQKRVDMDDKRKNKEKDNSLGIPIKQENGVKKSSVCKQLWQIKTSKLPPICLRVDPLPRKKTVNGTSRSPSPPGLKVNEKADKDKTEREQQTVKDKKGQMPKKEIQAAEANVKLSNEAENSKQKSQVMMTTNLNEETAKVMNDQQANEGVGFEVMKVKTVEILENGKEVEKEDDQQPIDKAPCELDEGKRHMESTECIITDGKKVRKILSQEDAAVRIQSAHKGFEVRRSQPLEKLQKYIKFINKLRRLRTKFRCLKPPPQTKI
ncbi:unnamed protein product [Musa textilis]